MKKILNSFVTTGVLFAVLFYTTFMSICSIIPAFNYYVNNMLYNYFDHSSFTNNSSISIVITMLLLFLLIINIVSLAKNNKLYFLNNIKLKLYIITIIFLGIGILIFILALYNFHDILTLVIFPFNLYTAFIAYLFLFIFKLTNNDRYKNIFIYKFFKLFKFNNPITMTILAISFINFMILVCNLQIARYLNILMILICISIFALILLLIKLLSKYALEKEIQYLEIMNDKIKAEQLKTQLITNVSHDIKTPLTSIINYTDIIYDKNLSENEIKEYCSVIYKKSQRLKTLIDDLIDASKASTNNIATDIQKLDLAEILGQITGEFDELLGNKNLKLIATIPEQNSFINSDGRYLWRILENLFSNICKYSLESTRVYLSLEDTDNKYILKLKNISKSELNISADELMEQFIRGDYARTTEGSGLGLYIVKNLAVILNCDFNIYINGDLFEVELRFLKFDVLLP